MENKVTDSHRFFLKLRQIVLTLFLIFSLSLCGCNPRTNVDVPASEEGLTDQGDAEQETGTQVIPRKNLGVTGEFSLRNGLGKLLAGTEKGLYFVLRGKLFFWDYSLEESLELATLDTRNGHYFYDGDHLEPSAYDRSTTVDKFYLPCSSIVVYQDRLYYAQGTEGGGGEAAYQVVSLNLQGQDMRVEFELPDKIGLFYLVNGGQGLIYQVGVDQSLAKNLLDFYHLFFLDKQSGDLHRIAPHLYPGDNFYCTEDRCYFAALDEKADRTTTSQSYRLYSWDTQTKELMDEQVDVNDAFFPQQDHLVGVNSSKYYKDSCYQLYSVKKNNQRKTLFERPVDPTDPDFSINHGVSEKFSFVACSEDYNQKEWKIYVLSPEGRQINEIDYKAPERLTYVMGIVDHYLVIARHLVEDSNYNYYLMDVLEENPKAIPLLPEDYFK